MELCLHSPNTPSWRGAQLKNKVQGQLHLLPSLYMESKMSFQHEFENVRFSKNTDTGTTLPLPLLTADKT
jgi:hypothetical protein